MNTNISIVVAALIYYVSYHGSVGVLYDIISLAYQDEESLKAFVKSTSFDDIAAFSSFFVPAAIASFFLGLSIKDKPIYFGVVVCGCFSIILWASLAYFFGAGSGIRASDVVAPLLALPLSWLIIRQVRNYA